MINLNKHNIKTKKEFIKLFIYYYEYTFILEDFEDFEVEKELNEILKTEDENFNKSSDEIQKLWNITYLKLTKKMCKDYPLSFLKNEIDKLIKNYDNIDKSIFLVQIDILKDVLNDASIFTLELRPYEQLKLKNKTPFAKFYSTKEEELVNYFNNNIELYSERKTNNFRFIKNKDSLISFPIFLFEFYGTILLDVIMTYQENEEDKDILNELIEKNVHNFCKASCKKINNSILNELINMSTKYINEYLN